MKLQRLLKPTLLIAGAAAVYLLEKYRPVRTRVEDKQIHDMRNLAVSVLSAATIRITEKQLTEVCTAFVEKNRFGLLLQLKLNPKLQTILAVVLLDYTLYLWHVLTHNNRFLWRFHEIHHLDLDLTATTALRFHFVEMGLSTFWRCGQVLLLGIPQKTLALWQSLTLYEIIFHHSNIRLPLNFEKVLSHIVVTPRMHGIHHSTVKEEAGSNWSSGLSIWDRIHGTLRLDVPQDEVEMGVPAYGTELDVKLISLLKKPFTQQRKSFREAVKVKGGRSRSWEHVNLLLNPQKEYLT